MEFVRYLRDIFIVLGVLLIFSGLTLGWWLLCVFAWVAAGLTAAIVDYRKRGLFK